MPKICLFGDSITWGAWDPENGGWGARLRKYFETNNVDVDVYNCGVSGDTTDDLLKRIDVECVAREPQIIVLAIGINDARYLNTPDNLQTPLDKFQQNMETLIEKAKKHAGNIVCLGLTKVDDSKTTPCPWKPTKFYTDENVKGYDAKIKEVSQSSGVLFLYLHDILDNTDLEDGLHPNPQGHEKMFLKIKDFLLSNNLIQK